ncbi:hypothetical protein SPI_00816 [Niveomyces insectorum RCEF 264]|uniref:DUF202 domain-containing protein n=1 Tax=Niveomyces insectorum RCEF 264 TaxID=1081102 RepID=A0A168ADY7_9HYPO|nr:hypothetical protein SPI_00816 [Niveomyces insectorum RCEF 264]
MASAADDPPLTVPSPSSRLSPTAEALTAAPTSSSALQASDSLSASSLTPVHSAPATSRQPPSPSQTTATSSGVSPLGVLHRSLSLPRPIRRQSTSERLNAILETARQRAESLSTAHNDAQPGADTYTATNINTDTRRHHLTFVRMEPLLRNQSAPGNLSGDIISEHESSADETTGIVSAPRGGGGNRSGRTSRRNYQSTATATGTYGAAPGSLVEPRSSSGPRLRQANSGDASNRKVGDDAAGEAGSSPGGRRSSGGGGGGGGGSSAASGGPANTRGHRTARGHTAGGGGGGGSDGTRSWWRELWSNFQSIELENKGSVARDHLALERTYLAWLRTSLAFASIGIAVTQLFRLNTLSPTGDSAPGGDNKNNHNGEDASNDHHSTLRQVGRPLGTTFLGISILILFLGYHRYYQSQQWILKGKFPASRGTILLVSLVALALMVVSLVVVVVVNPEPT